MPVGSSATSLYYKHVPRKILISAGEASGDLYAASLTRKLRQRWPDAEFYGCTGPRMREAGVKMVVDAASLAVVGLVEVVAHIPRIYREYRKLVAAARADPPDLAILTDSPDFHLRLARRLKAAGIPIVYLVAPQVWAWRQGRLGQMRRLIDELLCIFPFEETFFRSNNIPVTYIGHPLSTLARPSMPKAEFFKKHRLPMDRPLIVVTTWKQAWRSSGAPGDAARDDRSPVPDPGSQFPSSGVGYHRRRFF